MCLHPRVRRADLAVPLITVDLDGVLALPWHGRNLTARGPLVPEPPRDRMDRLRGMCWSLEALRYGLNHPVLGARHFLAACSREYRIVLLSARGQSAMWLTRRWLRRHGLAVYLNAVVLRPDSAQPPHDFKASAVSDLGAVAHVDDDGMTALYVHRTTGCRVLLLACRGNRGVYPPGILRLPTLAAIARSLAMTGAR